MMMQMHGRRSLGCICGIQLHCCSSLQILFDFCSEFIIVSSSLFVEPHVAVIDVVNISFLVV